MFNRTGTSFFSKSSRALALCSMTLLGGAPLGAVEAAPVETAARAEAAEGYVLLPVKSKNPQQVFRLMKAGEVVSYGSIEWADTAEPDYYVGLDLAGLDASALQLTVDGVPQELNVADSIPGQGRIYEEPLRPQVHFSAQRGWLNDPNGLVYRNGVWHLFFQHNPYGSAWGNMHWGHATSADLIHWEEQPIAIRPVYGEAMRDFAFSGSAVYDARNTLDLAEGPALVAIYTSTGRGEALAYSYDNGQTWTDYPGNPVLIHGDSNSGTPGEDGFWHDSRDPKVFWYSNEKSDAVAAEGAGADGHWVMVVYEQYVKEKGDPEGSAFAFYVSDNLRDWSRTQVLKTWYECVDLFQLAVEGEPETKKWVLVGAHGFYQIGAFDGREFAPDAREGSSDPVINEFRPYTVLPGKYHGPYWDGYAGQLWNDVPEEDGRKIGTFWVRGPAGGARHFSQKMSIPVEHSLRRTDEGLRLFYRPVRELDALEQAAVIDDFSGHGAALDAELSKVNAVAFRLSGTWQVDAEKPSTLKVHGLELVYDPISGTLDNASIRAKADDPNLRHHAGTIKRIPVGTPDPDGLKVEIIADQGVIEVFIDGGRYYGIASHLHEAEQRGIEQTGVQFEDLTVKPLKSIWK